MKTTVLASGVMARQVSFTGELLPDTTRVDVLPLKSLMNSCSGSKLTLRERNSTLPPSADRPQTSPSMTVPAGLVDTSCRLLSATGGGGGGGLFLCADASPWTAQVKRKASARVARFPDGGGVCMTLIR